MKLICFPHYTCGGLLSDILNNTFSSVGAHGGLNSFHHNLGKIGVVDSDTVLTEFDSAEFSNSIKDMQTTDWIGTHHWPGKIDTDSFDKIIVVTTETYRSRLYRWTRAYHHYYLNSDPWTCLSGQDRVDKERETAKNYIIPFCTVHKKNVVNIEFSEIVEQATSFKKLVENQQFDKHVSRWQHNNNFLYQQDLWYQDAAKRFHEAELEVLQKQPYMYE